MGCCNKSPDAAADAAKQSVPASDPSTAPSAVEPRKTAEHHQEHDAGKKGCCCAPHQD